MENRIFFNEALKIIDADLEYQLQARLGEKVHETWIRLKIKVMWYFNSEGYRSIHLLKQISEDFKYILFNLYGKRLFFKNDYIANKYLKEIYIDLYKEKELESSLPSLKYISTLITNIAELSTLEMDTLVCDWFIIITHILVKKNNRFRARLENIIKTCQRLKEELLCSCY